jgi:light-regulated signal transduction histidine kinase (bacteriophytochrome)
LENTHQVTARQRIEEEVAKRTKELAEANENLQETNAELAQFAYISSHDLQEPLRKISVYSQMAHKLIDASTHPREANFLTKITSSTGRMQALIRDVLAYSELSTPDHLFTQVDLNVVAANVKGDFELLIEEYQATIEWVGLPVLDANEVQLSQLFGNMMSNALKFTSKNRAPILRITASSTTNDEMIRHALSAGKEYITLHFADNGIGILPENRKIIFNIFQRLHRKSEYEGTGIGLALCKKIALNHHGAIDAEGSSEEGAVFNVILPVKQVPKKP